MSSDDDIFAPEGRPEPAALFPLLDDDPAKVGDFWLDARVTSTPAGTAFVAHEDGGDATLLMLLSAGAAKDPAARSRFSDKPTTAQRPLLVSSLRMTSGSFVRVIGLPNHTRAAAQDDRSGRLRRRRPRSDW